MFHFPVIGQIPFPDYEGRRIDNKFVVEVVGLKLECQDTNWLLF